MGATAHDALPTLERLRLDAAVCTACPLYRDATQTVFGEGSSTAEMMLVGEQPGDKEDLAGEPFVGPAGRLLDESLELAGIDRATVYVTNAVKHFKWEPRGKARIHKKPNAAEIKACFPWLEQEIAVVRPAVIVALGATAARSVFGKPVKISESRGTVIGCRDSLHALVTIHPSAILRAREERDRATMRDELVADLRVARAFLSSRQSAR